MYNRCTQLKKSLHLCQKRVTQYLCVKVVTPKFVFVFNTFCVDGVILRLTQFFHKSKTFSVLFVKILKRTRNPS